jgi:hypothetical protein
MFKNWVTEPTSQLALWHSNCFTQWLDKHWEHGRRSDKALNLHKPLVNDLHRQGVQTVLTLKLTLIITKSLFNRCHLFTILCPSETYFLHHTMSFSTLFKSFYKLHYIFQPTSVIIRCLKLLMKTAVLPFYRFWCVVPSMNLCMGCWVALPVVLCLADFNILAFKCHVMSHMFIWYYNSHLFWLSGVRQDTETHSKVSS